METRIKLSEPDERLDVVLDGLHFQPSLLPANPGEVVGEQRQLWDMGERKRPRGVAPPRADQPELF